MKKNSMIIILAVSILCSCSLPISQIDPIEVFFADIEGETITYIDITKYDSGITKVSIGPNDRKGIEKTISALKTLKYHKDSSGKPATTIGGSDLTVTVYTKKGSRSIHYPKWEVDGVWYIAEGASAPELYERIS